MLIINHRINTIDLLEKTSQEYGVEIDLHAYGNKIVLHHDPFIEGVDLEEWLKYYNHKFIILNIKEEGIEKKALELMEKYKIKDFFMLDLSFPALMKLVRNGEKRIAVRVSDYESIENATLLSRKVEWVWIDLFNKKFPLSKKQCNILHRSNFKLCLVSPELHPGNDTSLINDIKVYLQKNNIEIEAVCTKNAKLWK